jgi:16S rRNA G966 N2-methylase RsmD
MNKLERIIQNLENAIKRKTIKNSKTSKTQNNKKETRKIYEGHAKGNFFFPNIPKNTRSKIQYDDEALFSITDAKSAKMITEELLKLKDITKESVVTDMTSCVGGNVISFSQYFSKVNAIELDQERFKMLKHNVDLINKRGNVNYLQGNGIDIVLNNETTQDILFMDPPWGGTNYKTKSQLSLYLSDDSGKKYNIANLIIKLLDHSKYVAIKVPTNFNVIELKYILRRNGKRIIRTNTKLRKMHLYVIA